MPRKGRVEFPGAVYHLICQDSKTDPFWRPPLNRVDMAEQGANGWIFARSWYQYDNVNREVAIWREEDNGMGGSRGERYWYDVTDQLTNVRYNADQAWTGSPANWNRAMDYNYTPDRLNRTSTLENGSVSDYQPNALNQYASVNGQGIGYDGNFNVTSYNGVSFSYDAQNRLVGGSMQATYDGLGRCVRRTTSSGTRLYTYDDWNPIVEWDQWGNFAAWNMYGARPDEILLRFDAVQGPMVYKQDQHGNVVALLDQWGNIAERYSYDAFGKPKVTGFWDDNDRGGSWYGNRFMFQGREWISELGIYDYRNRMYQPQLGRFLQTDPTGFGAGDMNLFRYCGNDPVDRSDPTGLMEVAALLWRRQTLFDSGSVIKASLSEFWKAIVNAVTPKENQSPANSSVPVTVSRKIDLSRSGERVDPVTGTHWVVERWEYTFRNASGHRVGRGVPINEDIKMDRMVDYKDFKRHYGAHTTDDYGRVYDDWKVGFSSSNGTVQITQTLSTPNSPQSAVQHTTVSARGWYKQEEADPLKFQ